MSEKVEWSPSRDTRAPTRGGSEGELFDLRTIADAAENLPLIFAT